MRHFLQRWRQMPRGSCPFCGTYLGDAKTVAYTQAVSTHLRAWHMGELQRLQPFVLGILGSLLFLGVAACMAWGWHD
jgi:hypothetical protein